MRFLQELKEKHNFGFDTTLDKIEWFMLLRVLIVTCILAITVYYQVIGNYLFTDTNLVLFYTLIGGTYLITFLYTMFLDKLDTKVDRDFFVLSQIVYDVLYITVLIYITGSDQSIFSFLYLVSIIFASLTLYRKGAIFTTLLTIVIYSALMFFSERMGGSPVSMVSYSYNLAYLLTGILSITLAEQIRTKTRQLKKERYNLQAIMDNMTSGLMTVSGDGNVVSFNRAAEQITGFYPEEILGKKLVEKLPEFAEFAGTEILRQPDRALLSRYAKKFYNKSGELLYLGVSVSPFRDRDEEEGEEGRIIIFQDMTEVVKMEEQLRLSDKLAAVGKLASGIAHEIRNPLASMSGSVQMLRSSADVPEQDQRLLDIILKETDRLNGLIEEFLDYVRPGEKKRDPIHLFSLIGECVEMVKIRQDFPSEADIHCHVPDEFYIEGDEGKIKQVFLNLLINGMHAFSDAEKPEIKVTASEIKGDLVEIIFRDNGCGIRQENLDRIFDPFFTTKSKGTGLGLATVYKIVETHDGNITADSEEGKGTSFSLVFPVRRQGDNNAHRGNADKPRATGT